MRCSFLYSHLLQAKVKRIPNTTLTLFEHYKMSKAGKNSLPNHEFLRDFKDDSNNKPKWSLKNFKERGFGRLITLNRT